MNNLSGAQGRNRTTDTVIFSHVLYQLSYLGAEAADRRFIRRRGYRDEVSGCPGAGDGGGAIDAKALPTQCRIHFRNGAKVLIAAGNSIEMWLQIHNHGLSEERLPKSRPAKKAKAGGGERVTRAPLR
jgi:hypothetical protein